MTQADLAEKEKEEAIKRVARGATQQEYLWVSNIVGRLVYRGQDFTSEDVISELGDKYDQIREPRLIGAVIRNAKREGWIFPKGMVKGTRAKRHGAWVMKWGVN